MPKRLRSIKTTRTNLLVRPGRTIFSPETERLVLSAFFTVALVDAVVDQRCFLWGVVTDSKNGKSRAIGQMSRCAPQSGLSTTEVEIAQVMARTTGTVFLKTECL